MADPGYVPAPIGPAVASSENDVASAEWVRKIIDVVNRSLTGKLNVGLAVSLDRGATSKTIVDPRIDVRSGLQFCPLTPDAAAIEPSIYVSSRKSGTATIVHGLTGAASQCVFTLTILG